MLTWNDLESDEKIDIYDLGVYMNNRNNREGVYDLLVSYRSGDVWAPQIENAEALNLELGYFNECILQDKTPINDGHAERRIVKMLQAANESLANRAGEVLL
jgi:hypothetical protein